LRLEPFERLEMLLALDLKALVGKDFVENGHRAIAPFAG
jgi:hypothetical protein